MTGDDTVGLASIGQSLPRARVARLVAGRGRYSGDIVLPRMVHCAFVRSPYPFARLGAIDTAVALAMPGVIGVFVGADLARISTPMQTMLAHLPQHRSATQHPLAIDQVSWQGEPVVAVVAISRALAEDAAERVVIDWQPLVPVADPEQALSPDAPVIHPSLGGNCALAFDLPDVLPSGCQTITRTFRFARHTGVPLEPRTLTADYDPSEDSLRIYQSHQAPHLMQALFARHLGIAAERVRVTCPDVGGAFGVKLHLYGDELAVAALSKCLGRPVSYAVDRMEAFVSDVHAREFSATAELSLGDDGSPDTFRVDWLGSLGAYSIYPRSSIGDGMQALTLTGAPYRIKHLAGRLRLAYLNKVPTGAYRGVGQPLACTVTELLIDEAAAASDCDPLDYRLRHCLGPNDLPLTTAGGLQLGALSLTACLDRLAQRMDYSTLRAEQQRQRRSSSTLLCGIGVVLFIEQTAVGAGLYGPTGQPLTAEDYCSLRLAPNASIVGAVGSTDQGQGTLTGITQIVADAFGLAFERVVLSAGDSGGPHGGGAWASRGLAVSGEAAHKAALELRRRVLNVAASVLQTQGDRLDIRAGRIVSAATGEERIALEKICELNYYQQHLLPPGGGQSFSVTESFLPSDPPYFVANGAQASCIEVDTDTGFIRLLGHWVVEDCGRVVNPQLVDEQLRGAIVQGLGAALFEQCDYDADAQLRNASLADYLVPMAVEMPDIDVAHIETPQAGTALGVKGAGEAGIIAAGAAVGCALNDALRHRGVWIGEQPYSPEVVLRALNMAK